MDTDTISSRLQRISTAREIFILKAIRKDIVVEPRQYKLTDIFI